MTACCPKTHMHVNRGRKEVDGTEVLLPSKPKPGQSKRESAKMRARFRRRAAIEPVISHLKHQYRLIRCFLKGFIGDQLNLLLAAAAWKLRKGCGRRPFFGFNSRSEEHTSEFQSL